MVRIVQPLLCLQRPASGPDHTPRRRARPALIAAAAALLGGCLAFEGAPRDNAADREGRGAAVTAVTIGAGVPDAGAPAPIPGFLPKARFVPVTGRAFDSRIVFPGTGAWSGMSFDLGPAVPPNVLGAVVNLTATNASQPTHLSTCWTSCNVPDTSNVNISPGQTVANMVIIANQPHFDESRLGVINGNGEFGVGRVDIIVDVLGYFIPDDPATGGGYIACDRHAQRVFDSRLGDGKVPRGGRLTLHVGDPGSVAMLNVTVTNPEAPGYISVLSSPGAPVVTSTTNYLANETRANLTMAQLDGAGNATFFSAATTHLVIDRVASLVPHGRACPPSSDFGLAGASFVLGTASRIIDTRGISSLPVDAGVRSFGVSQNDTVALLGNLTAVGSQGIGYFFDYTQSTSILNMQPGDTRANFAVFPIMNDGQRSWFNVGNVSASHFIIDQVGFLVRNRAPQPANPQFIYGTFSADGANQKVQKPGASQASTWTQLPIRVEQPFGAATGPTAPVALNQENLGIVRINEFISAATISGPPDSWGLGDNRPFNPRLDGFANRVSWEIDFIHGIVKFVASPSCIKILFGAAEICLEAHPVTTNFATPQEANKVMFRTIERPDGVHYYVYSSAENAFSNVPGAPHCAIDVGFELLTVNGVLQARPWNPERGVYLDPYPSVEVYQYSWDWDGSNPIRTLFLQRESASGPGRLCDYENKNPFAQHPLF